MLFRIKIIWLTACLTFGVNIFSLPVFAKDTATPSQTEVREMLKNICGQNNILVQENMSGEDRLGCSAREAKKRISLSITNEDIFRVEGFIYGSFSKPGVKEALVDIEATSEPRSLFYGGSMLLRRSGQGWSFVWYKSGLRLNNCLKVPFKNNQSNVICKYEYYSANSQSEWLTLIDFENKTHKNTTLLSVSNNLGNCKPPFRDIKITKFSGRDINSDGTTDIILNVRAGISNAKKIPESQCNEVNGKLPNSKMYQLVFLYNGKSFQPTPQTAKQIKHFDYLMKTYITK
ncbi:hypothetical protein DSM106972_094800 [Dulcicalothrix desertica PCC 7102]|uniref:Uncharacterized protein n=1 Tax=Dulcicalothrix desertica PCC 7102 TaxID=232991 RepID=A0A433UJ84_9CYAN|nr:hypothetical protein [Dulcicalothrix desertica]RUS93943.1 hypothetical protein DSM106972_094800 [Dulcicalothrix desertica PCC 7102]TWH62709.1 hypothetical protein CAL7102_00225 [Dulcicalothrix desertica PCC 7102]